MAISREDQKIESVSYTHLNILHAMEAWWRLQQLDREIPVAAIQKTVQCFEGMRLNVVEIWSSDNS